MRMPVCICTQALPAPATLLLDVAYVAASREPILPSSASSIASNSDLHTSCVDKHRFMRNLRTSALTGDLSERTQLDIGRLPLLRSSRLDLQRNVL